MKALLSNLCRGLLVVLCFIGSWHLTAAAETAQGATNQITVAPVGIYRVESYREWRALLDSPLRVPGRFSVDCAGPIPHIIGSPHDVPFIQIYANPMAWTGFSVAKPTTMPVGSIIVKEKLDGTNRLGYAVMQKRARGFDPLHGDWDYTYFDDGLSKVTAQGKVASCRDCHANAKETDYLFRAYARLFWLNTQTNASLQLNTISIRPPQSPGQK